VKKNKSYKFFLSVITMAVSLGALSCAAHKSGSSTDSTMRCIQTSDCTGDGVCISGKCFGSSDSNGSSGSGILDTAAAGVGAAVGSATPVCIEGHIEATQLAPQVILLLDGSTTMNEAYGNSTKWAAMRDAMVNPTDGVVKTVQGRIAFALAVFSGGRTGINGGCPFPDPIVPHNVNNYDAIAAALPQESPGMYTPTGVALDEVCKALPGVSENGLLSQYVILATDGEPNSCGSIASFGGRGGRGSFGGGGMPATDYQSVIDAANRCCAAGVTIYVVSLQPDASSDFQSHLQQIADIGICNRGGAATLYSPQNPDELSSDLGKLVSGVLNCDVQLNGDVVQGKECKDSEVKLGTQKLKCNDDNGWILVNSNVIRLQGAACESFKNDPSLQVTAKFPCDVFTPGTGGGGNGGAGGSGSGTGSDDATIII
jgi:hypothetical protein